MKTRIYKYKDAQNFYWKITLEYVGFEPDEIYGNAVPNYIWDYEIFRSIDDERFDLVYNSTITGISDLDPDIRDILKDWANSIIDVCFGLVKYGKIDNGD